MKQPNGVPRQKANEKVHFEQFRGRSELHDASEVTNVREADD
jgi:hypothetical protein